MTDFREVPDSGTYDPASRDSFRDLTGRPEAAPRRDSDQRSDEVYDLAGRKFAGHMQIKLRPGFGVMVDGKHIEGGPHRVPVAIGVDLIHNNKADPIYGDAADGDVDLHQDPDNPPYPDMETAESKATKQADRDEAERIKNDPNTRESRALTTADLDNADPVISRDRAYHDKPRGGRR